MELSVEAEAKKFGLSLRVNASATVKFCSVSMAEMQSFFNLHRAADSANGNVLVFTSEDLKAFTNNFNGHNLIGITQSGRFYRGQLRSSWSTATEAQNMTVKIWDQNNECLVQVSRQILSL